MPAIYSTYTLHNEWYFTAINNWLNAFIIYIKIFLQVSLNFHSMFELKK